MEIKVGGKYRHFKGSFYEVLCLAKHSDTMEDLVVYKSLYGKFGIWVRPAKMWDELVKVNGEQMPRFRLVSDAE